MRPLRLVIFDFDGTLCDSAGWFCGVYNGVARRFGLREVGEDEFEALRGLSSRDLVRRLEVPTWKMPLIAAHMRKLAARDAGALRLFPGVPEMLTAFDRAGLSLAIVSSNAEANVRGVLGPGLSGLVGYFGCGASLFGKQAKFRAALRRMGVAPAQALAIGDEQRDIESARAVGLATGAVGWGYASPDLLLTMGPDWFFEDVAALAALAERPEISGQKRQHG